MAQGVSINESLQLVEDLSQLLQASKATLALSD
jgi:hypothetical protein